METDYIFEDISGLDIRLEGFDADSTGIVFEYTTETGRTTEVEIESVPVNELADILDPDSIAGHPYGIDFFENPQGQDTTEDTRFDISLNAGNDIMYVTGLKKGEFLESYTSPERFYSRITGSEDFERDMIQNFDAEVSNSGGEAISSDNIGRWGVFTGVLQEDDSQLYLAEPGARGARVDYDGKGLEQYAGEEIRLYGGLKAEGFEDGAVGEFVLDTITYEEI